MSDGDRKNQDQLTVRPGWYPGRRPQRSVVTGSTQHTLRRGNVSETREMVSDGYVPQYWMKLPSPPDATETKSGFAWQLPRKG